jgi:predicted nucleic acid-binding protein
VIAYLDSSALLRVLLGQVDALPEWGAIETAVGSALVEVECLRTLDRLRLRGGLSDEAVAVRREALYRLVAAMEVVDVGRAVLVRAAEPFPTSLGTLDAIHLATALLWREERGENLAVATHDLELGRAARALGFPVVGIGWT